MRLLVLPPSPHQSELADLDMNSNSNTSNKCIRMCIGPLCRAAAHCFLATDGAVFYRAAACHVRFVGEPELVGLSSYGTVRTSRLVFCDCAQYFVSL